MPKRRSKGDGGLTQRHDHKTCPPLVQQQNDDGSDKWDDDGNPVMGRAEHTCKGRWVGTFVVNLPGGRKQRKTIYGNSYNECKARFNKAKLERDSGTLVLHAMTVETWAQHWFEMKKSQLKPQSIHGYESHLRLNILPSVGRVKLADLQPEHIRMMHADLAKRGLASGSIRIAHAILKVCLKDAVYDGKLPVSPVDKVRPPKAIPVQNRDALTVDQARAVLAAAGENPRWWLALFYGMRQGECLGLTWGDIDWTKKEIHIRQTLQRDRENKVLVLGEPKTKAAKRTIPLFPMIEARLKVKYLNDERPADSELVFRTRTGTPIQPEHDYRRWGRLLNKASVVPFAPIPKVPLHSARNTAASLMDEAGLSDRLVAAILGHTNVQMTHGYQRATTERMRNELARMAELLPAEPLALPPASGE